jgi:hypothetical protein
MMTAGEAHSLLCQVTRCLVAVATAATADDQAQALRTANYTITRCLKKVRGV